MGSTIGKRVSRPEARRVVSTAASGASGPKRLVWRISATAPLGEWVDPTVLPVVTLDKAEPAEVTTGGFLSSSFDLLRGTDVQELPGDTVPADLYDEFFPELAAKHKP